MAQKLCCPNCRIPITDNRNPSWPTCSECGVIDGTKAIVIDHRQEYKQTRKMLSILADEIVTYRRRMGDANCVASEVLTEAYYDVTGLRT